MKKYNLSAIMKRAWNIKRSNTALSFSSCLKQAWKEEKERVEESAYYGVEFENNMTIRANGYERTLSRWTKSGRDRVYINGGSRSGDGYVDLVTGRVFLKGNLTYQKRMAEIILSMKF